MARPPMPIGAWGKISSVQLPSGVWQAQARYRDQDGVTRLVRAHGATSKLSESALADALRTRRRLSGEADITPETAVSVLAEAWISELDESRDVLPQTLAQYRGAIRRHIGPGLGAVRLREASAGRVDRFLTGLEGDSVNKVCRVVLTGMFSLAARRDAVAQNPVRETKPRKTKSGAVRAFTPAEVTAFRAQVEAWAESNRMGPPRAPDLCDLLDTLLGTAMRIGEALALQWPDVDLEAEEVTVTGTVVELEGQGLVRQPHAKSEAGYRTVQLPRFAVAALRRQKARGLPSDTGLVFPSGTGGLRAPNNVRRQIRLARGDVFDWVTPHTFRKTTATTVERAHGLGAAKGQLGHASEAVTERHYVQRASKAGDYRVALDALVAEVSDQ